MKAAVVTSPGVLQITTVTDPAPRDFEVVVAVDSCGICGTDVHVLEGDYRVVRYPIIPGHEFAGTVVAAGASARGVSVGCRVAVDPMDYCDSCATCRAGWSNMCLRGGGLGTTAPGALADFVAVNSARCQPIADSTSFALASLIEPLSCVLHGLDRIGPVLGTDALVVGAGPIGLLMAGLLARAGATVDVVDQLPHRREIAPAFGARRTGSGVSELDDTWDVVVDATGQPAAIAEAFRVARRTARIALLGVSGPGRAFAFEPFDIVARELTVIGVNSVRHSFGRATTLLEQGFLPTELLHGAAFSLDDAGQAIEQSRRAQGNKTLVQIAGVSG